MRKAPKVVLITAAALIGTGALLAGGTWAAAGFDLSRLSTVDYDWEQTVRELDSEATAPHSRIVVRSDCEGVRFEQASGDAIELEYWTGNAQRVGVDDADGTLTIDVKSTPMDGVMLDLSPAEAGGVSDTTTVIRVPASFTGAIEVESASSEVFLDGLHGLSNVSLSNGNGSTTLNDVSAREIVSRNKNGESLLSAVEADALTVTSKNGEISLGGVNARVANVGNKNGDVILADVSASELMTCENKNGEIFAQDLALAGGAFSSSNGDIDLSCVGSEGDYRIDAYSDNGDVDAPRGNFDATRTLRAENKNGDIRIAFS